MTFTESAIEQATIDWLKELGYRYAFGGEIAPGEAAAEREHYGQVILEGRLQAALKRINPEVPGEALEDAYRKIMHTSAPGLVANNRNFHKMVADGIEVEYLSGGRIKGDKVWAVDLENPENNDWLVVNQFTILENHNQRRPDVIVFCQRSASGGDRTEECCG